MDIFSPKKAIFLFCLFRSVPFVIAFFGMDSRGKVKDRTLLFLGLFFLYLKK